MSKGSYVGAGPYRMPAARIVARGVLSHTVPSTAFRGFGNPQVNWAVESNLDEGARRLGIDRLEIRLRNLARKGEAFIPWDTPADGDWEQTVRRAAELIGWGSPMPAGPRPGHRRGPQVGPHHGPLVRHRAPPRRRQRRRLRGHLRHGPGRAHRSSPRSPARSWACPLDWISVVMGDTAIVPYDQQTSASRSTVLMGNAVLGACRQIQERLRAMAATPPRRARGRGRPWPGAPCRLPDRELPVREVLTAGLGRLGGELIGVGESRKDAEPDHPLGGAPAFFEFNCTAVEAEVDEGTGDVTILRHVIVSDVGKALNPLQVRMQDEGAAIQGLGHTLMEQYLFDDHGRVRNLGAIDYRIPTSMDLPREMVSEIVENGDGPGPYGAKGMSEGALLCVASAVGNAVRDAIGVAIRDLPLTPERVWRALQEVRDGTAGRPGETPGGEEQP